MAEAEEPKVPIASEVFAPPAEPLPPTPVTPGPVPGASDLDAAGDAPTLDPDVFTDPRHKAEDDEEHKAEDDGEAVVPAEEPTPPAPPLIIPKPQQPRERSHIVEPAPPKRRFRLWRTVRRAVALVLILVFVGPPVAVLIYKVIPPPITWLMVERAFQGQPIVKRWVSLDDIDPSLPNAVIAGEDARFCEHHGFDFEAMQKAMASNERHPGRLRGGSTLSQQTAKNVFLWPGRDYVRKGLEAYFTVLIETLWGKRRIMEMYLNVVEWGPGTYGAEAAARRYFAEPATDIDPGEAARLAAILPSPLKWKAVNPGRYVQKRSSRIGAAAGTVRRDGLARCLRVKAGAGP